MNYRISEVLAAEDITTAGTKTIDINLADVISRLLVVVELKNDDYGPDGHPVDVLTKIEVVDGSEVIFSMSGGMAQAIAHYGTGLWDHNELNWEDKAYIRAAASIFFGRWPFDEELALDPTKFRNLQLKITHNYALGGCNPSAATLAVFAEVFDQKVITPRGYLLSKQHYSYTPSAGAAEYIDLPTDHPIRLVVPANKNDNEEPDIQFEKIKLSEEHDKRVVVDIDTMDLIRLTARQYPVTFDLFSGQIVAAARSFYFSHLKDMRTNIIEAEGTDTYMWRSWSGGRKISFDSGASITFHGEAGGLCPHGAVPILCGKLHDIDDWWDVTPLGSVRLKLTPRSSGCDTNIDNEVLTQQFRRY